MQKIQYEQTTDLSPWLDDDKPNFRTINQGDKQKPKIKTNNHQIRIHPYKLKSMSQRKVIQKNPIKLTDYQLPSIDQRKSRIKQQYSSLTIQPNQGKLIHNLSSHRLKSSQSIQNMQQEQKSINKLFKLSGKKYQLGVIQRPQRIIEDNRDNRGYFNNNTMLVFSKKKDEVLKRVLDQIQGRIKQLRGYQ